MKKYLVRRSRRLTVRPLTAGDYTAWKTAYFSMKPSRNRWDSMHRAADELTLSRFRRLLKDQAQRRKDDRTFDLAVFRNDTGELIGSVAALDLILGISQTCFLGYRLFNRHWGNGFGKEAARLMIDICFRDLKLHRIEAGIEKENRRSLLLARSLGLRKEGLKKRMVYLRGRWVDLVIYSATCEEFGRSWKGRPSSRLR